jgi:transcription elongation factor Elf1
LSRNVGETARRSHESGAQVTAEAAIFTCSICGEPSSEICVFCTKDACGNHRCDRCKRCSDCCECEVPLSAAEAEIAVPVDSPAEPPAEVPQPDAQPESQVEQQQIEDIPPPQHENPIF